ncbi:MULTISPECIES: hypothetical protein [Bradyrhizobium]|uniref:hypothetical protein n=1 Tax=Bradyrhizobium TaxID=374 RepID=UPI002011957D|nr:MULTISPECIES: hypothetical protein [Bradyrhizobium]
MAAVLRRDGDLVITQTIEVEVVQIHGCVVDEKGSNLIHRAIENPSAGPSTARDEIIVPIPPFAIPGTIEKPHALRVERTPSVVIDDVTDHGETVDVAEIDQSL